MCDPTGIAIGAAIGAATSAATGQDPLMGAVLGGATGGISPGSVGVQNFLGPTLTGAPLAATISASGVGMAAGLGLAGGFVMNQIAPKPYEYPSDYGSQQIQQAQTSPHKITGSGGAQASALLASEIQRVKRTRAKTQTSALNTQAFQTTGLQLA